MIVCTAGHIDHGKTSLVRALTGVDADRLAEEKARGITIDLGFAYKEMPDGSVMGFVDVPGHERFIHNMLAGVSGMDKALLVVAADDGVMPQTVEHVHILDLMGLDSGVVAITKADLVDLGRLEAVQAQVASLLSATGLANIPILPVSSVTGQGVDQVMARLSAGAGKERGAGRFRLSIDRAFSLSGAGVVVTGTAFSGQVRVGDRLLLSPSGREVRVRSLHSQNQKAERGQAGERLALNLAAPQLRKEDILRGEWLLDPALHHPVDRVDVVFRLLPGEARPLKHWTPVHLHLGAAHALARIALLEGDSLPPGSQGLAQLVLDEKLGTLGGDRFVLRDQSAQRTLGGGRVLDIFPPGKGRRTSSRLALLAAQTSFESGKILADLLANGPGWVDLAHFRLQWNCDAIAPVTAGSIAFSEAAWDRLRQRLIDVLAAHHAENPDQPGLQRPRLRSQLDPKMPPEVFAPLIDAALAGGLIQPTGPWLHLPGHQAKLSPADEALWEEAEPLLRAERFRPPRVRDLAQALDAQESEVRNLMKRLARQGQVVLIAQDHYFLSNAVAEMAAIAGGLGDWFSAADFRDHLDNGRKVAIQILEFFDRAGLTLRKGDRRKAKPERLTMFGEAQGREASPVGRPDFKSGDGRSTAVGGFDSYPFRQSPEAHEPSARH